MYFFKPKSYTFRDFHGIQEDPFWTHSFFTLHLVLIGHRQCFKKRREKNVYKWLHLMTLSVVRWRLARQVRNPQVGSLPRLRGRRGRQVRGGGRHPLAHRPGSSGLTTNSFFSVSVLVKKPNGILRRPQPVCHTLKQVKQNATNNLALFSQLSFRLF